MLRMGKGVSRGQLGAKKIKLLENDSSSRAPLEHGTVLSADGEEAQETLRGLIQNWDIVYILEPWLNSKERAILPYTSPWMHFKLLTNKFGLIYAGSYANNHTASNTRHLSRLSRLDVSSIVLRGMRIHLVPKGCGEIIEALAKYIFGEVLDRHELGEVCMTSSIIFFTFLSVTYD